MTEVPVLTSPLLAALPGVRHAFFTRQGGVSTGLFASLNVGRGSADEDEAVVENRRRAAARFGLGPQALSTCYQVHSARVLTADAPFSGYRPEADGVATAASGILCGALAADCAPVLMADAEARVVAAVHAGWRGAIGGVVEAGVAAMVEKGADPARIVAAAGPCIGPASYEVGLEFEARFLAEGDANARFFVPGARDDKRLFDLPAYVLSRLGAAGVGRAEWIGRDTLAEEEFFFSNRRAVLKGESDYGRLLSAICLTA
jgi:hypothetical protein